MSISLNLKKGMELDLTKDEYKDIKKFTLGLGWTTHMDLDSIAFLLDHNDKLLETVYFGNKNPNYGVRLNGDNRVGDEKDKDAEKIFIDFSSIPKQVKKIALYVNIYNPRRSFFCKDNFAKVENAFIRLVNEETEEELCRYNLQEDGQGFTAFHFVDISVDDRTFKTIGEGCNGSVGELEERYS